MIQTGKLRDFGFEVMNCDAPHKTPSCFLSNSYLYPHSTIIIIPESPTPVKEILSLD
jgi:hypothetical protein